MMRRKLVLFVVLALVAALQRNAQTQPVIWDPAVRGNPTLMEVPEFGNLHLLRHPRFPLNHPEFADAEFLNWLEQFRALGIKFDPKVAAVMAHGTLESPKRTIYQGPQRKHRSRMTNFQLDHDPMARL